MRERVAKPLEPGPTPSPSLTPPCCSAVSRDDLNLLTPRRASLRTQRLGLLLPACHRRRGMLHARRALCAILHAVVALERTGRPRVHGAWVCSQGGLRKFEEVNAGYLDAAVLCIGSLGSVPSFGGGG